MCTKFHQIVAEDKRIAYIGQSKTDAEETATALMANGTPYQWLIDGEIYEEFEQ